MEDDFDKNSEYTTGNSSNLIDADGDRIKFIGWTVYYTSTANL